MSLEDTFA